MFTPPRFVVVDDDERHLEAIASAIQSLGSVCAKIHYRAEEDIPVAPFAAVRAIFIDLQLQDRALTTDFNRHFSEIQRILTRVVNPTGGPFLLVVWTDTPAHVVELEAYLEKRFFSERPYARPVALVALSKTDYIHLDTGGLLTTGDLRGDILKHLKANAPMAVLVQWEVEVLSAASRVLADVIGLSVGGDVDKSALPTLLRRLATEAVGERSALEDPHSSLQAALLPLLGDHLQNASLDEESRSTWTDAFVGASIPLPRLGKDQVRRLNTKLHITRQDPEAAIAPTSWGAVCGLEDEMEWAEFGLESANEYLEQVVQKRARINWTLYGADVRVVQVRVGAACDYAQRVLGPIPFALAALLPERADTKQHSLPDESTCWLSPVVELQEGRGVQLFVDPRFVRVRGEEVVSAFAVEGRLKEQLLLDLISAISHHGSRPGIVRFRADA